MKEFEILLEDFKIECDSSVFKRLVIEEPFLFFEKIFDQLAANFEDSNDHTLRENISLLVILFQLYPDSHEELEKFITNRITQIFKRFVLLFFQNKYKEIDSDNFLCFKNIVVFVDLFFHNPHFTENLNEFEKEDFLKTFIRVTEINYVLNSDTDIQLAMEHSVSVFFYFPENLIEKYKIHFQHHFDKSVVDEFNIMNE